MDIIIDIASGALLFLGCFFILVGGIGMLRLPDFFTRIHPAGKVDTLGQILILSGLLLQSGFSVISLKILLIISFLFITSPTATHTMIHAAKLSGIADEHKHKHEEETT